MRPSSPVCIALTALAILHNANGRLSAHTDRSEQNEYHNSASSMHRRLGCRPKQLPTFDPSVTPETAVSFIAFGDTPYSIDDRYCLNHQMRGLDLSSPDGPSFIIHVGDIRNGTKLDPCNAEAYNDVAEIFTNPNNTLFYDPRDMFFVPGDNEWIDCLDKDEAWDLWMQHYGPGNAYGFSTFSALGVTVERQTGVERLPGINRGENFAFFMNKILFIGLNIIGGGEQGDESVRLVQNFNWTQEKLAQYSANDMKAAVIFAHAPIKLSGFRYTYFGNDFFALLRNQYADLPVMWLRGDGHEFCVKYPDPNNPNLFDVMVDEGGFAPPMLVSVLRNPVDDSYTFELDRRGGLYADSPAGSCPAIYEQTWTSPPVDLSLPELVFYGDGKFPLFACEGDCDRDLDCDTGLECFQRQAFENVPGCRGYGLGRKDYCFNTTASSPTPVQTGAPTAPPNVSPTSFPTSSPTVSPSTLAPTPPSPTGSTPAPTPPTPTGSTPAPTLPVLTFWGNPPDNPDKFPLAACEGDCDKDKQCQQPGLVCMKRDGYEQVPGCSGQGVLKKDYCYDPSAVAPTSTAIPTVQPTISPAAQPTIAPTPAAPTTAPTVAPTPAAPTTVPTAAPTPAAPSLGPTIAPTPAVPSTGPTMAPTPPEAPSTTPIPTTFQSGTSAPSELPQLNITGAFPLGLCQGDCDSDGECESPLLCFKRNALEAVYGCSGTGKSGKDYCYAPPSNLLVNIGNDGVPADKFPLDACQGDCDNDSECGSGLACFKRSGLTPVPGCVGDGKSGRDYCYSPGAALAAPDNVFSFGQ